MSKTPLSYFITKKKIYDNQSSRYLGKSKNFKLDRANAKLLHDTATPIIPFLPLAVNMNFDLVLGVKDGPYSMYEIIRVDIDKKNSAWFVLDSKFNGKQFVGLPKDLKQQAIVKKIANAMGITTYQADLLQPKVTRSEKVIKYLFSYNQIDPENQTKRREIRVEASIPKKFEIDGKRPSKKLSPKRNRRNSHAMNHSSMKLFALIDIYRAVPMLASSKIVTRVFVNGKNITTNSTRLKFQKILGVPIKSLISQTIVGFGTNSFTYSKTLQRSNYSLELIESTSKTNTYLHSDTVSLEGRKLEMQNIRYVFDKVDGREELRSVELRQNGNSKLIGLIEFNPALPDLRYKLPIESLKSRITISVNGKNGISINAEKMREKLVFFLGEAHLQNDSDGKGLIFELLPGDARTGHRKKFLRTPEWMYMRPVSTLITKNNKNKTVVKTRLMSPQDSNLTLGSYSSGKGRSKAKALRSFHIKWNKRAHRLGRLIVRSGNARNLELKQHRPNGLLSNESLAYMEGGTWGNGGAASDKAIGYACVQPLTGGTFYQVTSSTFPLRQRIIDFPYNIRHFKKQKAEVHGYHQMRIKFDHEVDISNTIVSMNGFKITSGPNHKEIGITNSGMNLEVVQRDTFLDNGEIIKAPMVDPNDNKTLIVNLFALVSFGPEFSRTVIGPAKQNLLSYSAYSAIDLLIVEKTSEVTSSHVTQKSSVRKPFRMKFSHSSNKSLNNECLDYQKRQDIRKDHSALLTKLSYFTVKANSSSKRRVTRYIRSMSFKLFSTPDRNNKHFRFKVDNVGEISWRTKFQYNVGMFLTW